VSRKHAAAFLQLTTHNSQSTATLLTIRHPLSAIR
jgi:hypothetical protein